MPYKLIPNPAKLSSDDSIISICAIIMAFLFLDLSCLQLKEDIK